MKTKKKILDVTCGSRSIWFDKNHPAAVYCDKRDEEYTGIWTSTKRDSERKCAVHPDVVCDFTSLPFDDDTFSLVVFDPPHLKSGGDNAWLVKKYGRLEEGWEQMLHDGFEECMRVLKPDGVLVFKWSECQIPAEKVWKAIGQRPLFGHHSGKKMNTFWGCFMKLNGGKTMTDEKKQIEEMAKDVTGSIVLRSLEDDFLTVDGFRTAEALYEIGYRKQVEGEWLERTEYNELEDCEEEFYQCSVCGLCTPCAPNFCMDCGAKMSGGNGNDR